VLLHDDVGEVGAGLERETLRLDKRVVTVEHDVLRLPCGLARGSLAGGVVVNAGLTFPMVAVGV
jgi:hypothetical protein